MRDVLDFYTNASLLELGADAQARVPRLGRDLVLSGKGKRRAAERAEFLRVGLVEPIEGDSRVDDRMAADRDRVVGRRQIVFALGRPIVAAQRPRRQGVFIALF